LPGSKWLAGGIQLDQAHPKSGFAVNLGIPAEALVAEVEDGGENGDDFRRAIRTDLLSHPVQLSKLHCFILQENRNFTSALAIGETSGSP
jgi:hypothetical protein